GRRAKTTRTVRSRVVPPRRAAVPMGTMMKIRVKPTPIVPAASVAADDDSANHRRAMCAATGAAGLLAVRWAAGMSRGVGDGRTPVLGRAGTGSLGHRRGLRHHWGGARVSALRGHDRDRGVYRR